MRKTVMTAVVLVAVFLFIGHPGAWASAPMEPVVQKNCMNCHQGFAKMKDILAGNLNGTSMKAKTIQMQIDGRMELLKFDAETKVKNIPSLEALKGSPAMRVHYRTVGRDRVATDVVVKPEIKVPANQLIGVEEMVKLVGMGPEKGGYTLVDSRPGPGYMKGHIPTAISIPLPKMKEMADRLPKEKGKLVIFYCEGFR